MTRRDLLAALGVATALGIGLLVLQRWVAETRNAAIILVAAWFVVVGVGALVAARSRPELRGALLGTYAAIAAASLAVGYWTGFRDEEVDEDVVMATMAASGAERDAALAGADTTKDQGKPKRPGGPVELASGEITGADGHAGSGRAAVVREEGGSRKLTFTDFEIDPGPGVVVWLTRDESSLDDRIELGGLKGNVGDQQYEIPADADLGEYDTVVLYCTPFTVRMAVASLS